MPPQPTDAVFPWDWTIAIDGVVWLVILILSLVVIFAARQGRDRRSLPNDLGRHVEDFAGVTQEANGPLTHFLLILYATVAASIITYMIITIAGGYNY